MDINDLIATLTEGLPADQVAIVTAAIQRDAVKNKAAGWKQQQEYDAIQQRATQLEAELQGTDAAPGTRAYKKWVEDNQKAISDLQAREAAYKAKYGDIANPNPPNPQNTTLPVKTMTPEEVQAEVDRQIGTKYSGNWSDLLVNTGNILQKHMLAGRKNPVDFKTLAKTAAEKYQGNLELAYEEYDKPERERIAKEETDALIERRVKEELQKRGASQHFPAAADLTPSALSSRTPDERSKFDRGSLTRDLANGWLNAEATQQ